MFRRRHSVGEERSNGHDADPTRNRCYGTGDLDRRLEVDVSHQTIFGSIDSDVDNDGATLDLRAVKEPGTPDSGNQNICLPC